MISGPSRLYDDCVHRDWFVKYAPSISNNFVGVGFSTIVEKDILHGGLVRIIESKRRSRVVTKFS